MMLISWIIKWFFVLFELKYGFLRRLCTLLSATRIFPKFSKWKEFISPWGMNVCSVVHVNLFLVTFLPWFILCFFVLCIYLLLFPVLFCTHHHLLFWSTSLPVFVCLPALCEYLRCASPLCVWSCRCVSLTSLWVYFSVFALCVCLTQFSFLNYVFGYHQLSSSHTCVPGLVSLIRDCLFSPSVESSSLTLIWYSQ